MWEKILQNTWLYGLVHGCGTLWVPATGLGSVSAVAVRPHLTKNPCLTVGKGGTDCPQTASQLP